MWRFMAVALIVALIVPPVVAQQEHLCSSCGYENLSITQMRILDGDLRLTIDDPQSLIRDLYTLPARNIWIGYENGGFDMPDDVHEDFRIEFRVSQNYIPGPLMYQGQLLQDLMLVDDELMIWFGYSETTGESYVFPFRTLVDTCTPIGEHCGEHLMGAFAVSKTDVDEFRARQEMSYPPLSKRWVFTGYS